jgi:hypothetical protein
MDKFYQSCKLNRIPIPRGLREVALAFEVADNVAGTGVTRGDVIGCGPITAPPRSGARLLVVQIGWAAFLFNVHGIHVAGLTAAALVKVIIKA